MSLTKKWKVILASLSFALLTACAGSSGGGSEGYSGDDGEEAASVEGGSSSKPSKPKEVIDENKLKKTEDEAMAANEENHKLRKEIFDAKNKLDGYSSACCTWGCVLT